MQLTAPRLVALGLVGILMSMFYTDANAPIEEARAATLRAAEDVLSLQQHII